MGIGEARCHGGSEIKSGKIPVILVEKGRIKKNVIFDLSYEGYFINFFLNKEKHNWVGPLPTFPHIYGKFHDC